MGSIRRDSRTQPEKFESLIVSLEIIFSFNTIYEVLLQIIDFKHNLNDFNKCWKGLTGYSPENQTNTFKRFL